MLMIEQIFITTSAVAPISQNASENEVKLHVAPRSPATTTTTTTVHLMEQILGELINTFF